MAVSDLQVVAAPQRSGGLAHIHADALATASAALPQIRRRDAGRRERRRARNPDTEWSW
jgi:hypothetical protein